MIAGRVLHARNGNTDVLRYEGDIRYPMAPSIEQFLDRIVGKPLSESLLIDLTATESIDSTNLGLLARAAMRFQESKGRRIGIVTHEDIEELLGSMGFHDIFDIVSGDAPEATTEIPTVASTPNDLRRTMLETHRTLMELNEKNKAEFQDIVTLLEQQQSGD